ncbi:Glycosyltransferase [Rhynchospora pubera]|uniref:Glycosyltransferase n=1 Tax=Rhynchospora pubera TaxID=906938 RepID=A0AAV8FCM1_9POAL|nr:Glycosyltransferase [Rhynchospora pubera]
MDQAPIPPHVVLLSSPGMGHIIPLASLAVCLTRHHGLSVTLISNTISSNQQSLQDFLSFNQVKLIKLEEPNEPSKLTIIFDPFYLDALDTAKELDIPCFLFFTTSCMALSFTFALPDLDKQFQDQFCDLPEPVQLLGCVPI